MKGSPMHRNFGIGSPIKDTQGNFGSDGQFVPYPHTHDGDTEGNTSNPHGTLGYDRVDDEGNAEIDFGISWGSGGAGFGPIISGHGAKQIGKFGKKIAKNFGRRIRSFFGPSVAMIQKRKCFQTGTLCRLDVY